MYIPGFLELTCKKKKEMYLISYLKKSNALLLFSKQDQCNQAFLDKNSVNRKRCLSAKDKAITENNKKKLS